ncbi:MAG: four helix bundle protein [Ruminococcaceae bacterium]|nr:four helix bundle protein [Oscillospiraceae bacterium]
MATRFISYRNRAKRGYIEFCEAKYIEHAKRVYRQRRKIYGTKKLLREETINFAIEISDICDNIKGCSVYINQLLRCSSSIGANLHEAKYAQSKADFINKLEIALKESFETEYWLELLYRKNKIDESTYKGLINRCGTIRRKLIASVTTAKNKQ